MQNRFAGLDSSEQSSAPQGYDGRGSGGRFGRGGAYTGTTVKEIQRYTSVIHLDLYTLEHLNTQAATLEEDPVSRRGAPTEEETAERRRRSRFVEISLFINVAAEAFFTWPLTPGARLHGSPVNSVSVSYGTPPTSSGLDQHL